MTKSLIHQFAMAESKRPAKGLSGSKRARDTTIQIMDLWYKQEVDDLSKEILETKVENKRLRRRYMLQHQVNSTLRSRLYQTEQTSTFRQLMIEEIFELFPAVHEHYTTNLTTEEEIGSETESEREN